VGRLNQPDDVNEILDLGTTYSWWYISAFCFVCHFGASMKVCNRI
jgi:hypothetical protein